MKKGYKFAAGITVILLISGCFYYTFPRKINKTLFGIKYKLGDNQLQEQIKITLKGYYYKRLFSKDFFEGSVSIDNKNYPGDERYPGIKLLVDEQLQMISYRDLAGEEKIYTYGEAFIEKNLNALTICVQEDQDSWNSKEGLMVTAPANNRTEALKISSKLMNAALKKNLDLK